MDNTRIPAISIFITFLVIFFIFYVITLENVEDFQSTKRINSIPVDPVFVPRYSNAYYYQPESKDYVDNLKRLLGGVCQNVDIPPGEWLYEADIEDDPAYIRGLYIKLYQYAVDRVDEKIIRDRIRKFMFLENGILFDVELLLYTEGKPYAKHIYVNALVEKNEKITIKDITLVGSVPEAEL